MPDMNNSESVLTAPVQHRCDCGQLVAIQTPEGLEIKCKRCKQVHIVEIIPLQTSLQG